MQRMQDCIKLRIGSRTVPVRSAQEEECVQLAGAVVKWEQAPHTLNASRGSSSAGILAACEPPRQFRSGEKTEGEGVQPTRRQVRMAVFRGKTITATDRKSTRLNSSHLGIS